MKILNKRYTYFKYNTKQYLCAYILCNVISMRFSMKKKNQLFIMLDLVTVL